MLNFICGGSYSNRETLLIDRIKNEAENGNVLVIIPDQFSFEYDEKLYKALGAKLFNKIQTAGFNRLAELLENKYGGNGTENATESIKIITMHKAVRDFRKAGQAKYYKKSLNKGSFIKEMIAFVDSLRESGITPNVVRGAAEKFGGTLGMKLYDIGLLYEAYQQKLDDSGMSDALTSVEAGIEAAKANNYFAGMNVFVDSFYNFSFDELKMLDVCMSQCSSMCVSFLLDNEVVSSFHNHPFHEAVKAQQSITDIAAAHNVKVSYTNAEAVDCKSDLMFMSKHLFDFNNVSYGKKAENISVHAADDLYQEAKYICSEISRLVREDGYRYSDIAIFVRNLADCMPVFDGYFEQYGIPFYSDVTDNIASSSLVRFMTTVFDCVLSKQFSTKNIIRYIKSPLYAMSKLQINNLEEYCTKWSVDGDMWLKPFTAAEKNMPDDMLEGINKSRAEIINPLEQFRTTVKKKNVTAGDICRALYDLLRDVKLSERTYHMVQNAGGAGDESSLELARNMKQLWNSVLLSIKTINECMENDEISVRQFYEVFRLLLEQIKVSQPPQTLDCVRVADAGHSRLSGVKAAFAAEVVDGIFPAQLRSDGLITEREKSLLKTDSIEILDTADRSFQSEKLLSYYALTQPSDKLYLAYSESDLQGSEKRSSILVKEIISMFGEDVLSRVHDMDRTFFCTSYKTAYNEYLEHMRDNNVCTASIRQSLFNSSEYSAKIANIQKVTDESEFFLSPKTSKKLFFNDNKRNVSPSQIEKYYKCPFGYFCATGLKLKKVNKIKVDGINRGNLIHYLLEHFLSKNTKNGVVFNEAVKTMNDEDIKALIDTYFARYVNEEMGGDFGKNSVFKFELDVLKDKAFKIVSFVREELINCKFTPSLMEYSLESAGEENRLTVEIDSDGDIKRKLVIDGKIDRADIYTDENGEKYIRIIDYKTGSINLNYSRMYNGLNLQMLIYLLAMLKTKNPVNTDLLLKKAGVIYCRFGEKMKNFDELTNEDENIKKSKESEKKLLKPCGLIVDDDNLISDSMYVTADGSFLPYEQNPKKSAAFTGIIPDMDYNLLLDFVYSKVESFGENLSDGIISAKPVDNACTYCDYSNICNSSFPDDAIDVNDKVFKELLFDACGINKEEDTDGK